MRIIHLGDEPWDSGLTEYSLLLASAQLTAGKQVLYFARENSHAAVRAKALGLPLETFSSPWREIARLYRSAKKFSPDIINAHTGNTHSLAVALNALLPRKAALIRTRADARPFKKGPLSALLWNRTAGFMAANTAILQAFKAGNSLVVCAVVQQGVLDKASIAAPQKKDSSIFKVAIVARLDPVKGHAVALEAFAMLLKDFPQSRLTVSGEDKNITAAQLLASADSMGIASSVEFCGRVPDVYAFMSGFDAGLVPSLGSEAVSRVALEWGCCGVPVIASATGGMADIVRDGLNGLLLPPGDAQSLYHALRKLATNKALREQLGAQARKNYLEHHTPQVFECNAAALYEQAIGNISH